MASTNCFHLPVAENKVYCPFHITVFKWQLRTNVFEPGFAGVCSKKMDQLKGDPNGGSAQLILKVELLATKNLIGANLNGMSDPYAIITCGTENQFR